MGVGDLVAVDGLTGAWRVMVSLPPTWQRPARVTAIQDGEWGRPTTWVTRTPDDLSLIVAGDPRPGVTEPWCAPEPDPYA